MFRVAIAHPSRPSLILASPSTHITHPTDPTDLTRRCRSIPPHRTRTRRCHHQPHTAHMQAANPCTHSDTFTSFLLFHQFSSLQLFYSSTSNLQLCHFSIFSTNSLHQHVHGAYHAERYSILHAHSRMLVHF